MSKALITAAVQINNSLQPAEAASQESARAAARLLCTMLEQHHASGIKNDIGISAIAHAARASMLAVEAREAQIRAHGALNVDLRKVGLEQMFGKSDPLPPNGPAADFAQFTLGATALPHA